VLPPTVVFVSLVVDAAPAGNSSDLSERCRAGNVGGGNTRHESVHHHLGRALRLGWRRSSLATCVRPLAAVSALENAAIRVIPGRNSNTRADAGSGQSVEMIYGSHFVVFSSDPDADRAFLAEVLGFEHVDAGGGWLIFGLPPAEVAVHPAEAYGSEMYFMCDDLAAEIRALEDQGVSCSEVEEARWGSITKVRLPSGGEVGLYKPRHVAMVGPS
jgi:hypothetical protein